MIILITGASHTGKTALAQKILEQYHFPYLSLDHLKMGLIRSHQTALTPMSSTVELTNYLWPITCEMIKTAIENDQNMVIEGCYIPFNWAKDFEPEYLEKIKYICLIMSEEYIKNHYSDIKKYANVVENRGDDIYLDEEEVMNENAAFLINAKAHKVPYVLINDEYQVDFKLD